MADRAVLCVYAFLQRKSQETYEAMLRAVDERCSTLGVTPNPTTVVTDFESASMAAIRQVLGEGMTTHGCFFHLTQSTWRKIQVVVNNVL